MRLPKTISLQVSRKLAEKTKDEIMTEVLRVFAGLDVNAVQVADEVVRVTFRSTFGRPNRFRETASFRFLVLYLRGGPPITRVHVFDFPFEEDNRFLEVAFEAYGAVKSVKKQTFLSNQIILNGTRLVDVALFGVLPRFLTVDGYLCRLWYCLQIFVPLRATGWQTALTRTSAESVGKPNTLLGIVPFTG